MKSNGHPALNERETFDGCRRRYAFVWSECFLDTCRHFSLASWIPLPLSLSKNDPFVIESLSCFSIATYRGPNSNASQILFTNIVVRMEHVIIAFDSSKKYFSWEKCSFTIFRPFWLSSSQQFAWVSNFFNQYLSDSQIREQTTGKNIVIKFKFWTLNSFFICVRFIIRNAFFLTYSNSLLVSNHYIAKKAQHPGLPGPKLLKKLNLAISSFK